MRWNTFESLARVVAAGVLGYFGTQMLLGHNPFRSGPPAPLLGPLFVGVGAFQLYRAWKLWPRRVEGAFDVPVERHEDLRRLDPKIAELAQKEDLTGLRIAAATDPKAALQLRVKLRKQLTQSTAAVNEHKKHHGNDPTLPTSLEELEKRHEAIRLELANLEKQIQLLSNKA